MMGGGSKGPLLSLPHERVEDAGLFEAQALVEIDGAAVGFRHRQRQQVAVALAQGVGGTDDEIFANAVTAVFRQEAHLRDMSDIFAHPRAQNQANQRIGRPMNSGER